MEDISAASLKREMDEMALLLREIQGGARELYDPASEKRTLCSKRLTNDQKRDKSSSSWAKSGVDRKKLFSGEKCCKPETDLTTDVAKSERTIKTRAASHSFGRRYAEVQTIVSDILHYDVKIESASNRKRVLSSKFSTAVRGDGTTANQNNGDCDVPKDDQMDLSDGGNNTDFDGIVDVDNASGSAANKDENISSKKKKIEKGYSRPVPSISSSIVEPSPISFRFPKSSRETVVKKYSGDGVGGVNLDVDSAEKKLHPHIMGTVMKPLTVPRIKNNESENIAVAQAGATSEIKIENNGANIAQKPPASIISNVEVLSSKIRTPAFTMHKDTTKKILNINISNIVKGTPGPGEYELDVIAQSEIKGGKFHHDRSTAPTKEYLLSEANAPRRGTPGPGDYEVGTSELYLRHIHSAPKFTSASSEQKSTPQIDRKKYWEEKARDASEDNDDMRSVNDSMIRSKVPIAFIGAGLNISKKTPKETRIMREHLKSQLEGEQGRDYDVNHSLVERKIITTVAMTREMLSQEANRKKLIEKPLVARVQAENKKGDRGRDQFYGPNLQVVWGDDTEAMKRGSKRGSGRGSGRDDDRSDGDVSPTDEILQFLDDRNGNMDNRASQTAGMFLRSSYSGGGINSKSKINLMRHGGDVEREEKEREREMRLEELGGGGVDDQYRGPQLQVDWLENMKKGKGVAMSTDQGRDETVILKKGFVKVKHFSDLDGINLKGDHAHNEGPGIYDITKGRGIGDSPRGKGMPFSSAIPRNEQVGPYGERPEYLRDDLATALDEGGFKNVMLDHEYGAAKDDNQKHPVRTFELYTTERHPSKKEFEYPAQEELGGAWFQGLAESVAQQRATVQISKMTGRTDNDTTTDDPDYQYQEGGLDLEINDYKPGMRRTTDTIFSDPAKNPRFEEFSKGGGKDEDAPDSISPKYSTQWKTEYALDMDKQSGREQIISGVKKDAQGTSDVDREVYGDNDRDLGLMILGDMEAATDRGTYMLSKSKRVRQIDLSKQTDRHKPEKHIVDEMGNVLDEKNVLELDLDKHLNGFSNPISGVHDWKKQLGREDDPYTETAGTLDPAFHEDKLIIDPHDTATTKYKRDVTGPSWHLDKTPRPGGQDGVEKEIKEEKDGKIYTSYDVKSGGEIDWNKEVKGNVPWAKNGARQTQASMLMKDYLLADRLLVKESLDLDPQHTGQSKYHRVQGASNWKSEANNENGKKIQIGEKLHNDNEVGDNLKLDIKDEFQQKRVLGGSMSGMLKYEGGGDPEVKENNSKLKKNKDDGDEKEDYGNKLYLDINDNNKHYKVKGGSVMGMKPNDSVKEFNIGYAAVREDLLKKGEITDSNAPLELVLDPDDSLMRRKVTGGSSMGFTPNSEGNPGVRSSRDLKNENSESYLLKRTYTPIEKETESKSESKSESKAESKDVRNVETENLNKNKDPKTSKIVDAKSDPYTNDQTGKKILPVKSVKTEKSVNSKYTDLLSTASERPSYSYLADRADSQNTNMKNILLSEAGGGNESKNRVTRDIDKDSSISNSNKNADKVISDKISTTIDKNNDTAIMSGRRNGSGDVQKESSRNNQDNIQTNNQNIQKNQSNQKRQNEQTKDVRNDGSAISDTRDLSTKNTTRTKPTEIELNKGQGQGQGQSQGLGQGLGLGLGVVSGSELLIQSPRSPRSARTDVVKSPSKVRFSTVDLNDGGGREKDKNVDMKKDKNKAKSNSNSRSNSNDDNDEATDNKLKQRKSSSAVMNNVSKSVKMKNEKQKNDDSRNKNENERKDEINNNRGNTSSSSSTLTAPYKSALKQTDKKIVPINLESDPRSNDHEGPVTPPRLLAPAVSGTGPPSFSPGKMDKLDRQLNALNV